MKRTIEEAKLIVELVNSSGEFVSAFCRRTGLSRKVYYNSRNTLIRAGIDVDKELPKAPRKPKIKATRRKNGNVTVNIPAGTDIATIIDFLEEFGISS